MLKNNYYKCNTLIENDKIMKDFVKEVETK